ncbi:uncharacterized protein LOC114376922 isoform X1 [Glycine soja]|uniref:uncharacterized protein LOC114376922 isoform X1 n=1 Tax=Glycine soja TaxID=3848 RepID=UPI0003DEB74D|nr:uncharacterized protein LOC114376922 isoform X1 [Glycine soja]
MRQLYILSVLITRRAFSLYFQLPLMAKLKLGYTIIWVLGLIMMPQVIGVLQCFIVLMEVDRFLVELVKMESHFLLNGMKVKEPLREHTMGSERNPLVLCSLTQPKINFWLLVKMAKSNFGIWTTLIF